MSYHGDISLGSTLKFTFTTINPSTGAPYTLAGTPVLSAYVDGSTTEITAGVSISVDLDSRTGLNLATVVATSGNGFATATNVDIVITTGTVNSVSAVGYTVGSFSIENRSALRPATAGRTLVVDASGLADANAVKVGPTGSGTAQTARDLGTSVLLSSGTGTGQINIAGGNVVNVTNVASATLGNTAHGGAGATLTLASETISGNFTAGNTTISGTSALGEVTAGNITVSGAIAANITGNLSGSVGSVTGGVGGNVAGSVASVTGNVAAVTGNVGGSVLGNVTLAATQGNYAPAKAGDQMSLSAGNVTGNLPAQLGNTTHGGSGATLTLASATISGNFTSGNIVGTIHDFDVACTEPTGVPAWGSTVTLRAILTWLGALATNKVTETSTTQTLYQSDGSTPVATATISDDGTTFTRAAWV